MTDVVTIVKTRSVQYSIAALCTGVPDTCYTVYPAKRVKPEKIIVLSSGEYTDGRFESAGKNGGFLQYSFRGPETELTEYFRQTKRSCTFLDHTTAKFKL